MTFERFEIPGLAQYSYVLASQEHAIVVDPKRDVDTYIRYAFEKNLAITHVLETHIHADYVSGATALSEATELAGSLLSGPRVQVVDVRSPKEWTRGHINTARHIPGGELPTRYDEIPREADMHLMCESGYRSSLASSVLQRQGFARVTNVVGGMTAWKNQSLPTVRESGERRRTLPELGQRAKHRAKHQEGSN